MVAVKRKQNWPVGVEKSDSVLMHSKSGHLQMLGHIVGEYFYTPDVGKDKWEIWKLSDLVDPLLDPKVPVGEYETIEFYVGQDLDWVHGEHHRIAKVIKVESDKVKLSGSTADYWIKKSSLIKKINRVYPMNRVSF